MKAKSIKGSSTAQLREQLQKTTADGFQPTLAIVFASVKMNLKEVVDLLQQYDISVFGATSNGEFIDEDLGHGSAAILLMDMRKENFFIQFEELEQGSERQVAEALGTAAREIFSEPALLIATSNLETDAEEVLEGLMQSIGENVSVFGAMAGDDLSMKEQFVFTNGHISSRGIVTVVINAAAVDFKGKATSGWKSLGTAKVITKCVGNQVYEIDGVPALDLCLKYSGLDEAADHLELEMATSAPLQLQRENGAAIMRPVYRINKKDRSLTVSGKLSQGAKVKFSLPPDFDTINTVITESQNLKMETPDAEALIMFNCAARYLTFGDVISKEVEGVKNVWNVPMVGLFSSAELARATDGNLEMHNLTTCYVALKEK